jgi:hypothetical protein
MNNNENVLAQILCHHPDTYLYMQRLNKTFVRESADLLLQTKGKYPISRREFARFCLKKEDFVCFIKDNKSKKYFRLYYCYEDYCHIKELIHNHSEGFATYFRHDNKNKRHIVVNNIMSNFLKKDCKIFFDVKTTYNIFSQRKNCLTAHIDYAKQAAEKNYMSFLKMFDHVFWYPMKSSYLQANYFFLENAILPYRVREHEKISAKNYENFIFELETYRTLCKDIDDENQDFIQSYFIQLKQQRT